MLRHRSVLRARGAFSRPVVSWYNDGTRCGEFFSENQLRLHFSMHDAVCAQLNSALETYHGSFQGLGELIAQTGHAQRGDPQFVLHALACSHFNHSFFWQCLSSDPVPLSPFLANAIATDFGSVETFMQEFAEAAVQMHSAGWVFLVYNRFEQKMSILALEGDASPATLGFDPLLVVDVWEHAYMSDFSGARSHYLTAFWAHVDWNFVASRLSAVSEAR